MGGREVLESEIWKLQDEVQELQDRLASAGQELHVYNLSCMEFEKKNDELRTTIQDLRNVNTGLVETVVDLRKALKEYGQHSRGCSSHNLSVEKLKSILRDRCDCGLDTEMNT